MANSLSIMALVNFVYVFRFFPAGAIIKKNSLFINEIYETLKINKLRNHKFANFVNWVIKKN